MSGWIAISRDIFKHEFFAREPMSEREAWVWMIARAAWEPTRHKVGNDMLDVPRGSFFCTLRELQQSWGWGSDFRVRTFLKRTQAERMIDTKTNAGKTQITICNYDEYQASERTENARKTQAPPQNKRTKETSNKEQEAKASMQTRGSRLPDDWFLPVAWGEWAVSEGFSENVIREQAERFRDHWHAAPSPRGVKVDWLATWRTWMRNARDRQPQLKAINGGRHDRTQFDSAHREYTRRLAAGQIDRGPDPSDPFAGR
jgi:hypothetical protein